MKTGAGLFQCLFDNLEALFRLKKYVTDAHGFAILINWCCSANCNKGPNSNSATEPNNCLHRVSV